MKSLIDKFAKNYQKNDNALKQNKIHINNDDALVEKGFCAFLQDLINSFRMRLKNDSMLSEIQKNEALTKEKFTTLFKSELEQHQRLSERQKTEISQSFENKYVADLSFAVFNNKIQKDEAGHKSIITPNDIFEAAKIAFPKTPEKLVGNILEEAEKNTAIAKNIHRLTKN